MMRIVGFLAVLILLLATPVVAQTPTINAGETVSGLLTTGEVAVEYWFEGVAGQFVSITMESNDFDAYLYLRDSTGAQVDEDDDAAGRLNARIGPEPLPATDRYTIIATSRSGGAVGQFTLTLESVENRSIEYGQRISSELTPGEPEHEIYFNASAGDTINIEMESNDFDTYLVLAQASPYAELKIDDDGGIGTNSRIGPFTLTETGEYIILARSWAGFEGEAAYTITLNKVDVMPIAFGETAQARITGNSPLYFSFEGHVDQVIDIQVNSDNQLDTALTLLAPSGFEVVLNEDNDGNLDPAVANVPLTEEGPYYILVQPNISRDASTPITVTLNESLIGSLDDGPKTVTLGDLDTNHLLTFEGRGGEQVRLRISINANQPISPSIYVTQNGTQVASFSSSTIVNEITFGFEVPLDGTVLIELMDYNYVETQLIFTLER